MLGLAGIRSLQVLEHDTISDSEEMKLYQGNSEGMYLSFFQVSRVLSLPRIHAWVCRFWVLGAL